MALKADRLASNLRNVLVQVVGHVWLRGGGTNIVAETVFAELAVGAVQVGHRVARRAQVDVRLRAH